MKKPLSQWHINCFFFLGNTLFLTLFYHHILHYYAFSDDYSMLHNILYTPNQFEHFQKSGRPILGWLFTSTWIHLPTINALIFARIFGLITCSLFFTCIFHDLRKQKLSLKFIIAIIIAIETSPVYAVILTWSTMFFFSLTAMLAYLAGSHHLRHPFSLGSNAISFIILFICAATYQPALTCFFIPLLFRIFFSSTPSLPTIKTLIPYFITFALANITYLILFKLSIWPFDSEHNARTDVGFSPSEKWQWLTKAYSDYLLPLHGAVSKGNDLLLYQCLIGIFTISGIILTFNKYRKHAPLLIPLIIGLPFLVIYPNLATTDNYIAFRTLATATILIICLVAVSIQQLPFCALRKGISLLFITLGCLLSYQNYSQRIIAPNIAEYEMIESQIKEAADAGYKEIIFIRPPLDYSPQHILKSEYGFLSSFHLWIPIRMTNLITAKFYQNPALLTVHQFAYGEHIPQWLQKRNLPIINVVK